MRCGLLRAFASTRTSLGRFNSGLVGTVDATKNQANEDCGGVSATHWHFSSRAYRLLSANSASFASSLDFGWEHGA